ncbi:hypothetical protein ACOME3_010412 [Neoechinorhynchus agilis]
MSTLNPFLLKEKYLEPYHLIRVFYRNAKSNLSKSIEMMRGIIDVCKPDIVVGDFNNNYLSAFRARFVSDYYIILPEEPSFHNWSRGCHSFINYAFYSHWKCK